MREWFARPRALRAGTTLLEYIIGRTTQYLKPAMAADHIKYVDAATGAESCANCNHIYLKLSSKAHLCSKVHMQIFPEGWCEVWEKGSKKYEFARTKEK